jgi:Protein of unknown function (DUF3277)
MSTYSFLNVSAFMAGPGVAVNLGHGAAAAEEGITIEAAEDKNVMAIGADGKGQHSLIASDAALVTVRLLKTSPANALLMAAYDVQTSSASLHGKNVITVTDSNRGDLHTLSQVAFKKKPPINYKKEADIIEWTFDAVSANSVLGAGI